MALHQGGYLAGDTPNKNQRDSAFAHTLIDYTITRRQGKYSFTDIRPKVYDIYAYLADSTDTLFTEVRPGWHAVFFSHNWYHTRFIDSIYVGMNKEVNENVYITRNKKYFSGTIAGHVFDERGNPLSRILVRVETSGEIVGTNTEGYFTVDAIEGEHALLFSSDHFHDTLLHGISVTMDSCTDDISMVMRKDSLYAVGAIKGSIVDTVSRTPLKKCSNFPSAPWAYGHYEYARGI
ncbi:MAG: hypothetical protein GF344_01530 [Chitinivibrionales bacterium]|nr:hypothetical protein [Chitinivibrionales bacterium]MBD3355771.1 hypothetical protein [Chitinivibrionales bacterium]